MEKLCTRWVPRLLTADQKCTRMKISEQCLEGFNKNRTDFVQRFLLWMRLGFTIIHQNPKSSQNSGQKPVVQHQRRQGRMTKLSAIYKSFSSSRDKFQTGISLNRVFQLPVILHGSSPISFHRKSAAIFLSM
jgi:hypothetical protein